MTTPKSATRDLLRSFAGILKLEKERGYQDKAVAGGLDSFIERNRTELASLLPDPVQAGYLLRVSYARLPKDERQRWVEQCLVLLGHGEAKQPQSKTEEVAKPQAASKQASKSLSALPLDASVEKLSRVGKAVAEKLGRLGVRTVGDLLYFFPRRHNDFSRITKISQLVPGDEQTVMATVWDVSTVRLGRLPRMDTKAVLGDDTGNVEAVWFGQPYVARNVFPGVQIALSGRVQLYKGRPVFESPEYEVLTEEAIHTGRLVPVYPGTEGLSPRTMRRLVWQALERSLGNVQEFLPSYLVTDIGLVALPQAIRQYNYPDSYDNKERARRRLAFGELFTLQVAVQMQRRFNRQDSQGIALSPQPQVLDTFLRSLPFQLTSAQTRVLEEVLADLYRDAPPMNRLLQGEVGSGKTVLALAAMLLAAVNGYQSAMMSPTEILAEQHFLTVSRLLEGVARPVIERNLLTCYLDPHPQPISVGLLVGGMPAKEKDGMRSLLAKGAVDIVIGTHALIEESVAVSRLALAVVDEQHRFGVLQRAALRRHGETSPHLLVMSATPIPRTLALTIYGDLDISTLDELPPGRQRVATKYVSPEKRDLAYNFVRKQAQEGRQAFVVCPLIEESEEVEARAAVEEFNRLSREVFPDLRLGLLHGKMSSKEKQRVMEQFRSGKLDILVSTPVVEVGIDVPNASVMLVEGADRFGLAQLHQLRGRVGRGQHKSYCLLLAENPSPLAQQRLSALEKTYDGFKLAELDLTLRGPGDLFGTRQSGLPTLKVATLMDRDLLTLAHKYAQTIVEKDPMLALAEHQPLAQEVKRLLEQVSAEPT